MGIELARSPQLDHLGRAARKIDALAHIEIPQVQLSLLLPHEFLVGRCEDILVKRGVMHGPIHRVLLEN